MTLEPLQYLLWEKGMPLAFRVEEFGGGFPKKKIIRNKTRRASFSYCVCFLKINYINFRIIKNLYNN